MSTRSRIGMSVLDKAGSKTIKSIYCHFDGNALGVGNTLHAHYQDAAKVAKLIALGDISTLGSKIGRKHDFDWRHAYKMGDYKGEDGQTDWAAYYAAISADPRADMVNAYKRDRGEAQVNASTVEGVIAFLDLACDTGTEYAYLFDAENGGWSVSPTGCTSWTTIPELMAEEEVARAAYEAEVAARSRELVAA